MKDLFPWILLPVSVWLQAAVFLGAVNRLEQNKVNAILRDARKEQSENRGDRENVLVHGVQRTAGHDGIR